ncbi:hypothetical protein RhiirB3_457609 [Rhizophagus irregularis]|nr:hypothetical protein RhiirB3_457609 [Rhizophagus irregularis]
MTRIESHLGLDLIPSPSEPDLDLIQEDALISHYFDAASTTIFFHCFWHIASLSPSAPLFIPTSSTQEEIDDLKNNRVVIESKLDQLTGHIKQFISSIGDAPLEQTDSVSSV